MNNVLIFTTASIVGVIGLLFLYHYLTRLMLKERAQKDIKAIIKALELDKLSLIQAQIQFKEVNSLLKSKNIQISKTKKNWF